MPKLYSVFSVGVLDGGRVTAYTREHSGNTQLFLIRTRLMWNVKFGLQALFFC